MEGDGFDGDLLEIADRRGEMSDRSGVVGPRGPGTRRVEGHILGGGLQSIERVPQRLPHVPGDEHLVGAKTSALGQSTSLIGTLPMAAATVETRPAPYRPATEVGAAPSTLLEFRHSDDIVGRRSRVVEDQARSAVFGSMRATERSAGWCETPVGDFVLVEARALGRSTAKHAPPSRSDWR